jgi:hypothetical protein
MLLLYQQRTFAVYTLLVRAPCVLVLAHAERSPTFST